MYMYVHMYINASMKQKVVLPACITHCLLGAHSGLVYITFDCRCSLELQINSGLYLFDAV